MIHALVMSTISEYNFCAGVTTIAGGKSNIPGYRDGPSEDAKFSTDFDVVYVKKMCSLLVIDRGNAALRKIALPQEDCTYQDSSLLSSGSFSFTVCCEVHVDLLDKKKGNYPTCLVLEVTKSFKKGPFQDG